jgi:hypothetical protein
MERPITLGLQQIEGCQYSYQPLVVVAVYDQDWRPIQ